MFLVPHPTTSMATFEYIMEALEKGDYIILYLHFALVFIIAFAILHFKLLYWNTKQYLLYKKSDAYKALIKSNGQISIMALPLTYTMSINVGFVLGAVLYQIYGVLLSICFRLHLLDLLLMDILL